MIDQVKYVRQAAMAMMVLVTSVPVIARVLVRRVRVFVDAELGGRDAGAQDAMSVHVRVADRQAAEGAAQLVERQTGVEQRAERHIAGDAGETIEVKDGRHALRCQCPADSLKLQYLRSPRIRWSTRSMPSNTPAAASRRVRSTSSGLGVGSPDGWL